ncbi:MAG: GDSL-type esterase/lipase family protein [Pseudomonadota bacterium]
MDAETASSADCIPATALDAYIQLRWDRRVDQWRGLDVPEDAVVFLGSSIIEEGEWSHLFPNTTTLNRGIGADATQGVFDRLDQIIETRPSKVFLYIGGNDFSRLDDTPEETWVRLQKILSQLQAALPETALFVYTLFPREAQHADKIEAFNALVRSKLSSSHVTVINAHPWFLGEGGAIDPTFSNDRIHLSGEAYRIWEDNIRLHLEK